MRKSRMKRIGEHTWIFPLESEKDRPNLGYIRGDQMAVAVDAGHSSSHVKDFYRALEAEMLPVPDLTVITHWHWDHTFGMHAVHGRTLARPETNAHLEEILYRMKNDPGFSKRFLNSDVCVRKEYAGGVPLAVVLSDEEIKKDTVLDIGGVHLHLCYAESPHTDDSLLVYVPEDRVVFVGDAQLGEFPTWRMDYDKMNLLAGQIREMDVKTVIDGHWRPYTKEEYLDEL